MTQNLISLFVLSIFLRSCNEPSPKTKSPREVDSCALYLEEYMVSLEKDGILIPEELKNILPSHSLTLEEEVKKYLNDRSIGGCDEQDKWVDWCPERIEKDTILATISNSEEESYSLVVKRAFSPHVHFLRIEKSFDEENRAFSYFITRKSLLTEKGQFLRRNDPFGEIRNPEDTMNYFRRREITMEEWGEFISMINYCEFWSLGNGIKSGLDGSRWILLGARPYGFEKGKVQFHKVVRWVPDNTAFKSACNKLLEINDEDLGEI